MMNYLLLSTKQYGFNKNRSTALQLLQIMDKWTKYLEYGDQIDVMYSDFVKAFDKIPHKRLIFKLIFMALIVFLSIEFRIFTARRYDSEVYAVVVCLCAKFKICQE